MNDHVARLWDEYAEANGGEVDLDGLIDLVIDQTPFDIHAARKDHARSLVKREDRRRTKFRHLQLGLPTMAEPDEYLVIGNNERCQKSGALLRQYSLAIQIAEENFNRQADAIAHRRTEFHLLLPYMSRGMTFNDAVAAYQRDHPVDKTGAA